MVEGEHLVQGPMNVPTEKGHLVLDQVHGVAGYPPSSGTSTSVVPPQCPHRAATTRGDNPLIRL